LIQDHQKYKQRLEISHKKNKILSIIDEKLPIEKSVFQRYFKVRMKGINSPESKEFVHNNNFQLKYKARRRRTRNLDGSTASLNGDLRTNSLKFVSKKKGNLKIHSFLASKCPKELNKNFNKLLN
jgi:hypothetical protein